jgi:hypothetical protein
MAKARPLLWVFIVDSRSIPRVFPELAGDGIDDSIWPEVVTVECVRIE